MRTYLAIFVNVIEYASADSTNEGTARNTVIDLISVEVNMMLEMLSTNKN